MGKRGPKPGSGGRPAKALYKKIEEGNPGKRDLPVISDKVKNTEFKFTMPPALRNNKFAKKVYTETVKWLKDINCIGLVPPYRIVGYALCIARWIECEQENNGGLLAAHPTTGQPIQSPYVDISLKYYKSAADTWDRIQEIVKQNSTVNYNPNAPTIDRMEALLLSGKPTGDE